MAQIWPKFGRILPLQHFPPLCWEGRGDRDISQDGCFEPRLTVPAIKLPFLMTLNHQKAKKTESILFCGLKHLILHIFTSVSNMIRCLLDHIMTPSTDKLFWYTQLFLRPILGNSRQIWLFFLENIGVEIWVIAKLFEQIKLPQLGCFENISQNIINLVRPALERGEEEWSGWKLELLFTLLTYFPKTLQAASISKWSP